CSGNFLYVTLELLKRLEGEVLNTLHDLGQSQQKLEMENVTVTPANLLGIEVNPRAAAIADLVLWIGFLQWHIRTHGTVSSVPEPILRNHHNIECRDAVLDWDERKPMVDEEGKPVTRWDGRTTNPHPVTGQEVPDPEARVQAYTYTNPRPAPWPEADYIVGNPPFIGNKRMRIALGDGYTEALREAWKELPANIDFVMYWWERAAVLVRQGKVKRFGFITTNSLKQTFNRKVLEGHLLAKKPLSMTFAIPDHPWVDSADGAAVRISMTVAAAGSNNGTLCEVVKEVDSASDEAAEVTFEVEQGWIHADLTIGANVAAAAKLKANTDICFQGMNLVGKGFRVTEEEIQGLGFDPKSLPEVIKPHCNARDMMQAGEHQYVIDLFGMTAEDAKAKYPTLYQRLFDRVKPERDQNKRESRRRNWWLFGEPVGKLRKAWAGLPRIILTPETSKHRVFSFFHLPFTPDHKLYAICSDDAWILGVLSGTYHKVWASTAGGRMGVGNDLVYNNTRCFLPFPFPAATAAQQARIRELGEQLDAHRKRQQAQHSQLTMTGMYNVLEKVRAGKTLTAKDKTIYDQGLVGILKQLHDELDIAVAEAYGWPDLAHCHSGLDPESRKTQEDEILHRLVALNAERAAEEAQGHVRWLRPEYQNPGASDKSQGSSAKGSTAAQGKLEVEDDVTLSPPKGDSAVAAEQRPWPKELPAQAAALREVLTALPAPADVATIAGHFKGKRTPKRLKEMEALLETLAALGGARKEGEGEELRYGAA
ncbi:MAG: hypothetical protein KDB96_01995, partial [Flavobacteriales bacterium]|nr:hypothetical protein [Flavobacteriales bacterium]